MGGPSGPLVALTDISLMMQIDPITLGKSSYIDNQHNNDSHDYSNFY